MILVVFRTVFTCTAPLDKPLEGALYKYQLLLLLLYYTRQLASNISYYDNLYRCNGDTTNIIKLYTHVYLFIINSYV